MLALTDAAAENLGWPRPATLGRWDEGRYVKEVGRGFAAVVYVAPGEGSRLMDGEVQLGEGIEFLVSATYLPAEAILEQQGYPRAVIEISEPEWDIDGSILTTERHATPDATGAIDRTMLEATAGAERFATAHASPLAFCAVITTELADAWTNPDDLLAAPAVLVAAGLAPEAPHRDQPRGCRRREEDFRPRVGSPRLAPHTALTGDSAVASPSGRCDHGGTGPAEPASPIDDHTSASHAVADRSPLT